MTRNVLVSILCADRVGLVSAVTATLFDLGGNLGDTAFAVLGEGAGFTTLCEVPEGIEPAEIEAALRDRSELADAQIVVVPFDLGFLQGPEGRATHHVEISGGDRPGLIARLSEVLVQFGANIVRLTSERVPEGHDFRYAIRIAARIPPERVDGCLATVANTAGELALSARWDRVEPSPRGSEAPDR